MDNYNIIAIIKSIRKLSILERKIKIAIAKQEVLIVILKSVANYDWVWVSYYILLSYIIFDL